MKVVTPHRSDLAGGSKRAGATGIAGSAAGRPHSSIALTLMDTFVRQQEVESLSLKDPNTSPGRPSSRSFASYLDLLDPGIRQAKPRIIWGAQADPFKCGVGGVRNAECGVGEVRNAEFGMRSGRKWGVGSGECGVRSAEKGMCGK
jgi:hypothetical protein